MQFLLKTMRVVGKLADGGATALLYLMVPFSLITAYGAYRSEHTLKAVVCVLVAVANLASALIYNRPTRRWLLMRVGSLIWNVAERWHIRLGRFDVVVFNWMMGSNGRRME